MDSRLSPEQVELLRTARQLASELGPRNVADLADEPRRRRLAKAVNDAGWLELREPSDGAPLASGVEAALIADALGEFVADVPFIGPSLAADLARRAGAERVLDSVVAMAPDLVGPAIESGSTTNTAWPLLDAPAHGPVVGLVLVDEGGRYRLSQVESEAATPGADLTRTVRSVRPGRPLSAVPDAATFLGQDDLDAWLALGLALTSADLVGSMRGVLDISVAYAKAREQYGVAIGSFQAVQHLLADAHTLMEAAWSVAQYAAWAVDELAPAEARHAGRVAKAYCARAARTVCETAVQVHGGIGNTWDCIVHVYLRRALLSSQYFGDDGPQLREIERVRLGVAHGLS